MNTEQKNTLRACEWRADLEAARDLDKGEILSFAFLIGWMEEWRLRRGLVPGREASVVFWREQVLVKPREEWQLTQWAAAVRWYFRWLELCVERGGDGRSVSERMRDAVWQVGARRGLAVATRKSYGGCAEWTRWIWRCGRRRTERRIPVVLNVGELLALIGKLREPYRLAAELQYGAGLRLKELVTLRIKDVVLVYTHIATGVNGLGVRSPLDGIPVGSG